MKRSATAVWQGSGKEGKGTLDTQSGVLESTPYSYKTRFEEGKGTNPEELIAAAHAGCFTMKLAFNLQEGDFEIENLETKCEISLEDGALTQSHLTLTASVKGIDQDKFLQLVGDAKLNCPVSKALNMELSVDATLNS